MKPFAIAVGDKKWRISNLMGVVKKKNNNIHVHLMERFSKERKGDIEINHRI